MNELEAVVTPRVNQFDEQIYNIGGDNKEMKTKIIKSKQKRIKEALKFLKAKLPVKLYMEVEEAYEEKYKKNK